MSDQTIRGLERAETADGPAGTVALRRALARAGRGDPMQQLAQSLASLLPDPPAVPQPTWWWADDASFVSDRVLRNLPPVHYGLCRCGGELVLTGLERRARLTGMDDTARTRSVWCVSKPARQTRPLLALIYNPVAGRAFDMRPLYVRAVVRGLLSVPSPSRPSDTDTHPRHFVVWLDDFPLHRPELSYARAHGVARRWRMEGLHPELALDQLLEQQTGGVPGAAAPWWMQPT